MSTASINNELSIIRVRKTKRSIDQQVFGTKVGVFAKIFGCWHENISRPFAEGHTSYRACLKCGARKQFDSSSLKTHGKFYYPPLVQRVEYI